MEEDKWSIKHYFLFRLLYCALFIVVGMIFILLIIGALWLSTWTKSSIPIYFFFSILMTGIIYSIAFVCKIHFSDIPERFENDYSSRLKWQTLIIVSGIIGAIRYCNKFDINIYKKLIEKREELWLRPWFESLILVIAIMILTLIISPEEIKMILGLLITFIITFVMANLIVKLFLKSKDRHFS